MVDLPFVEQIRTGKLKTYVHHDDAGHPVHTFQSPLIKKRTPNKVWINSHGIIGDDGIDDKQLPRDKALFAYGIEHYEYWKKEKQNIPFHVGQMGENLVIKHLNEYNVFIGDTFKLGEAIIQVSQPRLPCWRIAYHINDYNFAKEVKQSGLTGWHFRVLKDGFIREQTELELIERYYPEWSIARCNELLYMKEENLHDLYELANCHLLGKRWVMLMNERLKGKTINYERRLYGPLLD